MKEEVEQILSLIKNGQVAEGKIQDITERLKAAIKEEPAKGKELGALVSQIKQATKSIPASTGINWVQVENGFLGIGHKPGGKISYNGLKHENTAAVCTLLNENEGATLIGKQVEQVSIEWIWLPFSASKPLEGEELLQVHYLFQKLRILLEMGKKIYIHCSAGIHRTGMITYGLLRSIGMDRDKAQRVLQALRKVTADQVGAERLTWGDQFGK